MKPVEGFTVAMPQVPQHSDGRRFADGHPFGTLLEERRFVPDLVCVGDSLIRLPRSQFLGR